MITKYCTSFIFFKTLYALYAFYCLSILRLFFFPSSFFVYFFFRLPCSSLVYLFICFFFSYQFFLPLLPLLFLFFSWFFFLLFSPFLSCSILFFFLFLLLLLLLFFGSFGSLLETCSPRINNLCTQHPQTTVYDAYSITSFLPQPLLSSSISQVAV